MVADPRHDLGDELKEHGLRAEGVGGNLADERGGMTVTELAVVAVVALWIGIFVLPLTIQGFSYSSNTTPIR